MSEFGSEDPGGFFVSALITCPMDKIQKFPGMMMVVKLGSSILEILNSGSSLTVIGRGGGLTKSGIRFGVAGSNMETWKSGCTVQRLSGSCRVTEWVPGHARILYGPRNFSVSSWRVESYVRIEP